MIRKFLEDESGATSIEYAFIAALVAMVLVVTLAALGTSVNGIFDSVATKLDAANP